MAGRVDRQASRRTGEVTCDRQPPFDLDAEGGLLGSIALMPSVMNDVAQIVGTDDFYDDSNQKIFRVMIAFHDAGKPLDISLLSAQLRKAGDYEAIGGGAYLSRVFNSVPNAAHARHYADIVREKSRLRKIIFACTTALGEAYDELPPDDVTASLDQLLADKSRGIERAARPIHEVWASVIDGLQKAVGKHEPPALLSGLPAADRIGFVFVAGELTILAARPGVGKTSLAMQIAMHHATRARSVFFASLEMQDESLGSRPLMAAAGVNHQSVRTRGADQQDIDAIQQASDDFGVIPLYVWSPGRVKAGAIRAMAAAIKSRHGLRLIVVDYTSWIIPDDPRAQRRDQVGEIVKALRSVGQRLSVPVLLLHQLNREGANERPQLTHLRESGCVEEDADIVAFLHPVDGAKGEPPQVNLIVAKSRQGAKGEAPLLWHAEATCFEDTSDGREFCG